MKEAKFKVRLITKQQERMQLDNINGLNIGNVRDSWIEKNELTIFGNGTQITRKLSDIMTLEIEFINEDKDKKDK